MATKHDLLLQISHTTTELAALFHQLADLWPADGTTPPPVVEPPPVTEPPPPVDPTSLTGRLAAWNAMPNNRTKADELGQDGELRQYVYAHWPMNWPETYNQWLGHAQFDDASATTSNAPQIS